jgi:hypothetical protein
MQGTLADFPTITGKEAHESALLVFGPSYARRSSPFFTQAVKIPGQIYPPSMGKPAKLPLNNY